MCEAPAGLWPESAELSAEERRGEVPCRFKNRTPCLVGADMDPWDSWSRQPRPMNLAWERA